MAKATLQTEGLNNYELYNIGVWSSAGTLTYTISVGGGGHIDTLGLQNTLTNHVTVNKKSISIKTDSLDNVLYNKPYKPTYIKMDVEGAELEALRGATNIIARDSPKLSVCVYHKPEDIWEIPYYIISNYPDYKLYLRQHSPLVDTIMYAVC